MPMTRRKRQPRRAIVRGPSGTQGRVARIAPARAGDGDPAAARCAADPPRSTPTPPAATFGTGADACLVAVGLDPGTTPPEGTNSPEGPDPAPRRVTFMPEGGPSPADVRRRIRLDRGNDRPVAPRLATFMVGTNEYLDRIAKSGSGPLSGLGTASGHGAGEAAR